MKLQGYNSEATGSVGDGTPPTPKHEYIPQESYRKFELILAGMDSLQATLPISEQRGTRDKYRRSLGNNLLLHLPHGYLLLTDKQPTFPKAPAEASGACRKEKEGGQLQTRNSVGRTHQGKLFETL